MKQRFASVHLIQKSNLTLAGAVAFLMSFIFSGLPDIDYRFGQQEVQERETGWVDKAVCGQGSIGRFFQNGTSAFHFLFGCKRFHIIKQGDSYYLAEKYEIFADIRSKGTNHFMQLMFMDTAKNEVYDAANNGVMLLIWMVQGYCLQYFYGSFLEGRGQGKTGNRFCVAAFYVALKLWLSLCLPSGYGDRRTIETHFITFLGLVAAALFFYQAVKAITGFLVITFMAVCEIGVFGACIVGEIFDSVMDFWNWCMGKGYIHSVSLFENLQTVTYIVAQMLLCAVAVALPVVVFRKSVRTFREKDLCIGRTELFFLLAPGTVSLLICMLLQTYIYTTNGEIYRVSPLLLLIIPAILLLCLVFILSDVRLFQDMIDRNREKSSRMILEKQIGSMQEHIAEMDRMYSGIRGMKHDMKNSLTVIMQLANIKHTAEKYHGAVDWSIRHQVFTLSVMLQNE